MSHYDLINQFLDHTSNTYNRILESPSRLSIIVDRLRTQNSSQHFEFLCPSDHGLDAILAIHDVDYIEYLKSAYEEWCKEGGNRDGVIPEAFPHSGFISTSRDKIKNAKSSLAKAGFSNISGGSCFLNNAAIAAKLLINDLDSNGNARKVIILDIDYHHGNGTQDIFYTQSNPLYVSLHASNDYPWFTGETTEIGEGEGEGYNVNIPLPKETSDEVYCKMLEKVIKEKIASYEAYYLIVSLGG
ncbi:5227_t:CDS:2, partial [Racocetra fulgida]